MIITQETIDAAISSAFSFRSVRGQHPINFTKLIARVKNLIAVLYKVDNLKLRIMFIDVSKDYTMRYYKYETYMDIDDFQKFSRSVNSNSRYSKICEMITESGILNFL